MAGWFNFFSLKDSQNQRSPRYCLLKLVFVCIIYVCMVMLLFWWVFTTTISGYYKVLRRWYVNERFVKLTLSGKNINKWGFWPNSSPKLLSVHYLEDKVTCMNRKLYYSRVYGQIHLAAQFTSGVLWHFQNAPWKAGFLVLKGQKMRPPL